MRTQACDACAKRKVRCTREEPECSNCKRRKRGRCTYPEASPADRIKRLEAQIRALGGDPGNNGQYTGTPIGTESTPATLPSLEQAATPAVTLVEKSGDPVVLEEDGQPFYLESRAWTGYHLNHQHGGSHRHGPTRNPFMVRNNPGAFESVLSSKGIISLASRMPSHDHAAILWDTFYLRVNPLVTISFRWVTKALEEAATTRPRQLTDAEYAFIFAVYLISTVSLTDDECQARLQQSRSALLTEYQILCEEAIICTNLFCITDILVLKALVYYVMAGAERLSTQSTWSLVGLMVCNAEKLGVHRDGSLLGLSPMETEERRRLWWQLQHISLGLAVMTGVTPMTLMADWDAKLPLNIEDDEIQPNMTELPKERKGSTSMAYCLYTYWVIHHQRQFFQSQKAPFELSWQTNRSLPDTSKGSLIEQLEEGLNIHFLQYCDPLRPLDTLVQISARSLICMFRLRTLYPLASYEDPKRTNGEFRDELLEASIRCLRYTIALNSQASIKHFQWWTKGMFSWHALMCVLVEASQQEDQSKIQQIWNLLCDLYEANPTLLQLSEDRRRPHAAEIIVAAWKARQHKLGSRRLAEPPAFVTELEAQLLHLQAQAVASPEAASIQPAGVLPGFQQPDSENYSAESAMDVSFDWGLQDIDWNFWSSID